MIIQMILAYAVFILISALPVLVPVIGVVLLATGIWLLVRPGDGAGKTAIGILCSGSAVFLAMIYFEVDERIPGTRAFHDLKANVIQQQRAQRAVAPGGEFTRLQESIRGQRTCQWEHEPGAWVRRCANER